MIAPHRHLTYAKLLAILQSLPKERLEDDVTVYDAEEKEFFPVYSSEKSDENINDVLDPGHLYLTIKE
jgi:hypothetical protein